MRQAHVCALLFAGLRCSAAAAPTPSPDVTIVLDVKGHLPPAVLKQMEKETQDIIAASGLSLGWSPRSQAATGSFNDLVVLIFKGACSLEPAAPLYDELGPYAFTRVSNGQVQPFGEVDCDRIVSSVRAIMGGDDYTRTDLLMGRALGRVVAHELVHMLTRSGQHAHEGVQKSSLSGKQLISASLPLSALDIDRLRQEHPPGRRPAPGAADSGDSGYAGDARDTRNDADGR